MVIGAGLAGAATAYALARRGHEVTVLERRSPAAPDGSSHGSARIFRYAYPDDFYTGLAVESARMFAELEQASGRGLVTRTGTLDFGQARRPHHLAGVLRAHGVEHEFFTRVEAAGRWPGIDFDTDVLWSPAAGVIDAETTVTTLLDLAEKHGAQTLWPWEVSSIERTSHGFTVTSTAGEKLDAEKIVVAAGGWLPALLPTLPLSAAFLNAFPRLQVRQEQAFHFPYREQGSVPTFIHETAQAEIYGLPGGRDAGHRGQKVAKFNGGKPLTSAARQDGTVDPAGRELIVEYVRRMLPALVPEPYAETTCLFTSTPTKDFVLDGVDGLTVLSACSGHGAKFAPVMGELAAAVTAGERVTPVRFSVLSSGGSV